MTIKIPLVNFLGCTVLVSYIRVEVTLVVFLYVQKWVGDKMAKSCNVIKATPVEPLLELQYLNIDVHGKNLLWTLNLLGHQNPPTRPHFGWPNTPASIWLLQLFPTPLSYGTSNEGR